MKFSCFLLNNTKQSISCLVSQLFLAVSVQCITETSHGIKGFSFLQMSEEYLKNIAAIGHGKSRDDVTSSSTEIQESELDRIESELDRIMEGDMVEKGTRKFMVSYGGICGGALISGKHVLTAAHCCAVAKNYVTLGENRDIKVSVKSLRDHPKFSSKEYNYDLCIVTLNRDITEDTNIKDQTEIALLPVGGDCDKSSLDVNATGWGYFTGYPEVMKAPSNELRTSSQKCISVSGKWAKCSIDHYEPLNCPCPYENYQFNTEVMLCVEGKEWRSEDGIDEFKKILKNSPTDLDEFDLQYKRLMKNKCKGDSGSPLTFYNVTDKRFYVQGVASFGAPNCDYPNVYARVSAAYDWINCIINGDTKCHEKAYNAQNDR